MQAERKLAGLGGGRNTAERPQLCRESLGKRDPRVRCGLLSLPKAISPGAFPAPHCGIPPVCPGQQWHREAEALQDARLGRGTVAHWSLFIHGKPKLGPWAWQPIAESQ